MKTMLHALIKVSKPTHKPINILHPLKKYFKKANPNTNMSPTLSTLSNIKLKVTSKAKSLSPTMGLNILLVC